MSGMKQLAIEDASTDQIRAFAEANGLDTAESTTRPELLAQLSVAWTADYILVADTPQPGEGQSAQATVQPQASMAGGVGKDDPKVVLSIGTTQLPGGKHPVSVQVNGRNLVIQRNMRVEIPYRYYLALKNAVNVDVSQDEKTFERTETPVHNYPLQIEQMPSREEIEDWHARTDGELMPA